jgi:hypothetical protein
MAQSDVNIVLKALNILIFSTFNEYLMFFANWKKVCSLRSGIAVLVIRLQLYFLMLCLWQKAKKFDGIIIDKDPQH